MRLKYYLRGLGLGIAVTAVIMGATVKNHTGGMTDAQIIARARELGMVEGVLSEAAVPEPEETAMDGQNLPESSADQTGTGDSEAGGKEEVIADGGDTPADSPATSDTDVENTDAAGRESSSTIIVAIYPGESSYTVSRKLAALGLVESADIYDGFLCQNGYDKKVCTGNYEIKVGATAEEIAHIITKNQ